MAGAAGDRGTFLGRRVPGLCSLRQRLRGWARLPDRGHVFFVTGEDAGGNAGTSVGGCVGPSLVCFLCGGHVCLGRAVLVSLCVCAPCGHGGPALALWT